jgi:nucleoside-diphosphate-sugar epimerase
MSYEDLNFLNRINFDSILIVSTGLPRSNDPKISKKINNKIQQILRRVKYAKNAEIIFYSSLSIFDKKIETICDQTPCSPQDAYGESKVEMEIFLKELYQNGFGKLNIFRIPVFLYPGQVNNFMGKVKAAILEGRSVSLTNPNSSLSAIYDDRNLYYLSEKLPYGINVVNLSSEPDCTFSDIGDLAKILGAKEVLWQHSSRPSCMINPDKIIEIMGFLPSAWGLYTSWITKELLSSKINEKNY